MDVVCGCVCVCVCKHTCTIVVREQFCGVSSLLVSLCRFWGPNLNHQTWIILNGKSLYRLSNLTGPNFFFISNLIPFWPDCTSYGVLVLSFHCSVSWQYLGRLKTNQTILQDGDSGTYLYYQNLGGVGRRIMSSRSSLVI